MTALANPQSAIRNPQSAVIDLLPYQRALFADRARVVVDCWCRQAGKDFTAACKAVDDAIRMRRNWYIVSVTQRQADETFAKCRQIAEAFKQVLKLAGPISESASEFEDKDAAIDQSFRCTARTLTLPGGGKVTALPGRDPKGLAGLTGCVIFTEFGLFPGGGYEHWRTLYPLTTRGFQIVVISTPRGKNTKFHELVNDPQYSVHTITILDAVAQGLVLRDNEGNPCTIEQFRKSYGDGVGWSREFMCQFSGDLESLVKWGMLEAAANIERPAGRAPFKFLRLENGAGWRADAFSGTPDRPVFPATGRLEIGWDVARHSDFSAVWVYWHGGQAAQPRHLAALVLMHECEFALQREVLRTLMRSPAAVGCGDATGLGMDSNETLAREFPGRWQPFTFTAAGKREIGSLLRTAYGDGMQAIPPLASETKCIATDVYAVQCEQGGANMTLAESPNPLLPDSHCDIAYADGLALKSSTIQPRRGYLWVP